MQITLITSRSVVRRLQQLASTPLELVPGGAYWFSSGGPPE